MAFSCGYDNTTCCDNGSAIYLKDGGTQITQNPVQGSPNTSKTSRVFPTLETQLSTYPPQATPCPQTTAATETTPSTKKKAGVLKLKEKIGLGALGLALLTVIIALLSWWSPRTSRRRPPQDDNHDDNSEAKQFPQVFHSIRLGIYELNKGDPTICRGLDRS